MAAMKQFTDVECQNCWMHSVLSRNSPKKNWNTNCVTHMTASAIALGLAGSTARRFTVASTPGIVSPYRHVARTGKALNAAIAPVPGAEEMK
eukprot:CAMPEP_0117466274 /NCGR_PEP_ID=MMETSP0784-20121206/5059_1 /TAXON_ID=39447 /ORGANISM="" /LENGTH=91 /DNA_ID=CAMNT_0005260213 /DNA_START=546 /DNA_END=821 /DNA_ORIENTATION=-